MARTLLPSDIAHIVGPGPDDKAHTLYLNDGVIIRISPHTGDVWSACQLPTTDKIQAALKGE